MSLPEVKISSIPRRLHDWRWQPELNETYWSPFGGEAHYYTWDDGDADRSIRNAGEAFRTKEECESYIAKKKAQCQR